MKTRKKIINWLFEKSQVIYTNNFKKHKIPWNLTVKQLCEYPKATFGYKLGHFLNENGFDLLPKVERHDAYHVLTGFGTHVEDEIALQYLCYGNGKRSKYLFGVICLGTILLPEYFKYYKKAYKLGKQSNSFHHFDFKLLLPLHYQEFKDTIFSKKTQQELSRIQQENNLQTNNTFYYGTNKE
jgi:ubiquinone biosynthesis protein Coq4